MKLVPGTFLGVPIRTRSETGIIFTEYRYEPLTKLRSHSHELAYFSFVLRGSYEEQYRLRRAEDCGTEAALYHPAGEEHSDSFSFAGGHILSLELPHQFLAKAKDYELAIDERITFRAASVKALARR